MLTITIPDQELYNEATEEFVNVKGRELRLEHSLVSLSKWESKLHKPFLTKEDKSRTESIEYIKCMTITQNVDVDFYKSIPNAVINEVSAYIENPMTATSFTEQEEKRTINREVITAEIIYYWMVALQIPMECQKWHLNRLLTLINVCNIKNQPKKKMTRGQIHARNAALNAARRERFKSAG